MKIFSHHDVTDTGPARATPRFVGALAIIGLALTHNSVQADTVIWEFNLPATAVASQNPPYPSAARLTLVDTVDGVQFTLDPNQANPGYAPNSTVDALNIVFTGSADLPSSAYQSGSGPVADAESFGSNNDPLVAVVQGNASAANMDSSYTSADGQLLLTWSNPEFPVDQISVWTIAGTTIADNFSILATSSSNPSPAFGILSVSRISLDGLTPTPSNWVTGSTPVPVPAALWLFGAGLLGLVGVARRNKAD